MRKKYKATWKGYSWWMYSATIEHAIDTFINQLQKGYGIGAASGLVVIELPSFRVTA